MKNKEYISQCRYYKGEETNPLEKTENGYLWYYEQKWVEFNISCPEYLDGDVEEYKRGGLEDFSKDDNVPISLKSILFNRYIHWGGGYSRESDALGFKDWYITHYLQK